MLFGLRLVARRPRRTLLVTANMAVTVTVLVVVVYFRAAVTNKLSGGVNSGLFAKGISDPVVNRDLQMLGVITIMLVALALLNAIFTTWATVLDARRASEVMRALGAPARKVSLGPDRRPGHVGDSRHAHRGRAWHRAGRGGDEE
jgi:hypothetical protein